MRMRRHTRLYYLPQIIWADDDDDDYTGNQTVEVFLLTLIYRENFYLFYAVIKKCQSSIFITYKTTFFNETNKNLCFG